MTFDRTFFVTTVAWQRTPLFPNERVAHLRLDVLADYHQHKKYVLHGFVIMPDHLHLRKKGRARFRAPFPVFTVSLW
jgi:REP element-mobilizing transposase RayT